MVHEHTDFLDCQCSYMEKIVLNPSQVALDALDNLQGIEFDTMVGRGLSGALVIPKLADHFGVHWYIVRKPTDSSHSTLLGEGRMGRKWLFVDDLISSGTTLHHTTLAIEELCKRMNWQTEFAGAYLFGEFLDSEPVYRSPEWVKSFMAYKIF